MNKTLIYAIVGVIVLAAGGYALTRENSSTEQQMAAAPKTLKELMTSTVQQKCEFEDETEAAKTAGTVYISSGKFRGDFTAEAGGKTYGAHSVSDGAAIYTWIDGMATGFKVAVDVATAAEGGEVNSIDINKEVNYSCEPWTPDNSKFQIPSGITFNDLGAMMQGSAGASASGSASACSVCDMAPEPQKTECRKALKC